MPVNHVFIVVLLKFIGTGLLDVVSRNTNIDSDPLMFVCIIKIPLFTGWDDFGLI